MIAFALEDLQNITSPDARMGIAFFMEKVYTMGYEKNGHWCFGKNKEISDFLGYICGMGWQSSRPTKTQKETALALVNAIPEEEFANTISNSYPRDWRTIFDIICLISKYDQKKARNIISKVDTQKLSDMAKDVWEDSDDILHLCCALANGSNRIARQFVEHNQDRIHVMYSPLIAIAPQCAVELFERRIRIDIMSEHWWYYSYHALKELINTDSQAASQILLQNIAVIADRINSIHADYMEDRYCIDFIQLVCDFDPLAFNMLLEMLDESKIAGSWSKSYFYPYKKKNVKSRYEKLMKLLNFQAMKLSQ